jgi:hypothetical protein
VFIAARTRRKVGNQIFKTYDFFTLILVPSLQQIYNSRVASDKAKKAARDEECDFLDLPPALPGLPVSPALTVIWLKEAMAIQDFQ